MPPKKSSSAEGVVKGKLKRRPARLSATPVPAKVQMKQELSSNPKVRAKEKAGAGGEWAEAARQETFTCQKGSPHNEERPASAQVGEKEAKSD
ncbi:non-histone chromosomal protein HMG-14-like [Echinops telfairi]|uniref:Non-histone chromosomal protein HMG-14-like n=1 Tax=Echinops telfairi TaxID=9371 RepID=A0AC55D785_ECHTE|nr:non-histone chromosomal protein HMG-14-like [Echinops telfairi]